MGQKSVIWSFVALVVILPVVAFKLVSWSEDRFNPLPVLGPAGHLINDFSLKDQYGNEMNTTEWNDKIIVANFFFTHCPSICPKMMDQLKRIQAYGGKDIVLYSFSVDPERDSVGRLREYADKFGIKANWHLVTGDKKELYRFARKDLLIVATEGDGGEDDFIHSDNLVLIDPLKRIRGYYKGIKQNQADQLIKDIGKIRKEFKNKIK